MHVHLLEVRCIMKNVVVRDVLNQIFKQHSQKLNEVGIKIMFAEETEESLTIRVYETEKDLVCDFEPMEILKKEIPVIRKITQDECWYLGEKLNRPVDPKEVEKNVTNIVLNIGEKLRVDAIKQLKSERCINDCSKCKWKSKKSTCNI